MWKHIGESLYLTFRPDVICVILSRELRELASKLPADFRGCGLSLSSCKWEHFGQDKSLASILFCHSPLCSLFLTYQKWSLDCNKSTLYSFWTNCRILVLGKTYIFCYKQFCSHSIRMTRFSVLWNYCITWKNISHVKGWMSALFQTYTTVSSRAALTQTTTCRP